MASITLEQWTKSNFPPLIDSPSNLQESFNRVFPHQPAIYVNSVHVTAGGYMALLQREFGQDSPTSVTIQNMVVVPSNADSQAAGYVGFFFTATTGQRAITSSVNLVIEQDSSVEGEDKRKITAVNQVILDNGTNPLVLVVKSS